MFHICFCWGGGVGGYLSMGVVVEKCENPKSILIGVLVVDVMVSTIGSCEDNV